MSEIDIEAVRADLHWLQDNVRTARRIADRALSALDQLAKENERLTKERDEARECLRWAHDTLYEINPSNYDHDEVCRLNNASVEVILGIAPLLGEKHGKTDAWWAERNRDADDAATLRTKLADKHGVDLTHEQVESIAAYYPPGYTRPGWASAAEMLVPEGMLAMTVNCGMEERKAPDFSKATAFVGQWDNVGGEPCEASTPALALAAACLRAKG